MGKVVMAMSVLALALVMSGCDAYAQQQKRKKLNDTLVLNQIKSTALFPVNGNVYPDGVYYASVNLGKPLKLYFLDIDTGSNLPWVRCKGPPAPTKGAHPPFEPNGNTLEVDCTDPICKAVTQGKYKCAHPKDRCNYEIEYYDGLLSKGYLIEDDFRIVLTSRSDSVTRVKFGCGATPPESKTDGVLALGRGESSLVSQLHKSGITRNVVGHCFSSKGKGYVFIGDALVPSTGITWTPMSQTGPSGDYYSPGPAELVYGTKSTGVKGLRVIFDSGSTYTYLNEKTYNLLISTMETDLQGKPIETVKDEALPKCWKGNKAFKSVQEVKGYFSSVNMSFGDVQFEIPPAGYLIITKKGNACLGILNGSQVKLGELNLIGDVSFQDIKVIYDNENHRIGWLEADCTKPGKSV